ncbi:Ig-like domain-containing protein [Cellulomonas algicola]|uniref:Ig-like domain-containing protein n=1 Tax=Cellulomonas algicola TaxID=2071633 RepID=UPI001C3FCE02|nr:Ig-like domain-containing protein [Cellulomonas algicola]
MNGRTGRTAGALRLRGDDDGFTLVEVIVALLVLSIVATASLYFFVGGSRSVSSQQRQQSGVAVGNRAMEDVYSLVARASATGTSGLVVGRKQSDVTTAWNAAVTEGTPGLGDSYPAWDKATSPLPAAGVGDDKIKLTQTVDESGIRYTVRTLVGFCYRAKATPAAQCTRTGGDAAGVSTTGYMQLMRAYVTVSWADTTGTCKASTCRYDIASLVDPSNDLKWNNTTRLLAVDDSVSVDADDVIEIDVLDNDTIMAITTNPVSIVSNPVLAGTSTPAGTATVDTSTGRVVYDPSDDAWGEVTFTYRVTIAARTAQAVVHAYVNPMARPLTGNAYPGQAVAIPVTTMWGAAASGLAVVQPATGGSVVASGSSFTYTAPASTGTYTFRYTFTQGAYTSTIGTGTVVVAAPIPPVAGNRTFETDAVITPADVPLPLQTANGNAANYRVRIMSLPSAGTLRLDGNNAAVNGVGSAVAFRPPAQTAGVYTFTYQVAPPAPSTTWSATATATILVQPKAADDPQTTVSKNQSNRMLQVGANDGSVAGTTLEIVSSPGPACITIASNQGTSWASGNVQYSAPNKTGTCSFTYRLNPIDNRLRQSATVTAYVKVN